MWRRRVLVAVVLAFLSVDSSLCQVQAASQVAAVRGTGVGDQWDELDASRIADAVMSNSGLGGLFLAGVPPAQARAELQKRKDALTSAVALLSVHIDAVFDIMDKVVVLDEATAAKLAKVATLCESHLPVFGRVARNIGRASDGMPELLQLVKTSVEPLQSLEEGPVEDKEGVLVYSPEPLIHVQEEPAPEAGGGDSGAVSADKAACEAREQEKANKFYGHNFARQILMWIGFGIRLALKVGLLNTFSTLDMHSGNEQERESLDAIRWHFRAQPFDLLFEMVLLFLDVAGEKDDEQTRQNFGTVFTLVTIAMSLVGLFKSAPRGAQSKAYSTATGNSVFFVIAGSMILAVYHYTNIGTLAYLFLVCGLLSVIVVLVSALKAGNKPGSRGIDFLRGLSFGGEDKESKLEPGTLVLHETKEDGMVVVALLEPATNPHGEQQDGRSWRVRVLQDTLGEPEVVPASDLHVFLDHVGTKDKEAPVRYKGHDARLKLIAGERNNPQFVISYCVEGDGKKTCPQFVFMSTLGGLTAINHTPITPTKRV